MPTHCRPLLLLQPLCLPIAGHCSSCVSTPGHCSLHFLMWLRLQFTYHLLFFIHLLFVAMEALPSMILILSTQPLEARLACGSMLPPSSHSCMPFFIDVVVLYRLHMACLPSSLVPPPPSRYLMHLTRFDLSLYDPSLLFALPFT